MPRSAKPLTNYMLALFLLALYYLWYRYPFQINSSVTSPTYTDTPVSLQVAKYLLCFAIVGAYTAMALSATRMRLPRYGIGPWMAVVMGTFLVALAAVVTVITADLANLWCFVFLFAFVPLMLFPDSFRFSLVSIERCLRWFVYITTAAFIVQLALFLTVGRLPALSFEGSVFIRFGGLWDDPNGFAVFLSFLLPFVFFSDISRPGKVLLITVNLVSLLATQSFTGIFAFAASLVIVPICLFVRPVAVQQARRLFKLYLWLALAVVLGLCVLMYMHLEFDLDLIGAATEYLEEKQGSLEGHKESLDALLNADALNIMGLAPTGFWGESGYVGVLLNYGAGALLVYALLFVAIFGRSIRVLRASHGKPGIAVFYGVAFFLVAYGVAMFNLPLQRIFPVNLLVILFAALVCQTYRIAEWRSVKREPV
jgi:hypothetical protein